MYTHNTLYTDLHSYEYILVNALIHVYIYDSVQACTEMIMPMCADNKQDFFEPVKWDLKATVSGCAKRYDVTPRPYWVMTNYLGVNISGASNIIFR